MNKAFFATALLVLLVCSHAETFEKAKLRGLSTKISTEALFRSMKGTQFGKTLFSMIALKFKTSDGQLQQIVGVVGELQERIESQQAENDQSYAAESEVYSQFISGETDTISDATANLNNYQGQLADNQNSLVQANQQKELLEQEQASRIDHLAQLAEIRSNEEAAHNKRDSDQEALIGGLQQVIVLFQDQTNNAAVDQNTVSEILDLLNKLVAAFKASIASDDLAEQDSVAQYQAVVSASQARLAEIASSLAELAANISQLEAVIASLEDRISGEQTRLSNAEQLLAQYQQRLQDATAKYNSDTATRSSQVNLIGILLSKLTQNPDEVQGVLNNA